jgi:hypothetical protein
MGNKTIGGQQMSDWQLVMGKWIDVEALRKRRENDPNHQLFMARKQVHRNYINFLVRDILGQIHKKRQNELIQRILGR